MMRIPKKRQQPSESSTKPEKKAKTSGHERKIDDDGRKRKIVRNDELIKKPGKYDMIRKLKVTIIFLFCVIFV